MSKITVLILVICAVWLFSTASPCEAGLVDGKISANGEKSPESDHIYQDKSKDPVLENNQTFR